MKKNIKFRNNGGNSNAYSLNYKFDSISPAGKISGTALDLIKKYNELAKEAHGSGDYIEMEVYRQYAEHYRKIVTEINERKNIRQENVNPMPIASETQSQSDEVAAPASVTSSDNSENSADATNVVSNEQSNDKQPKKLRKSFKVVEIKPQENTADAAENSTKPSAQRRGRKALPKTSTLELENQEADAI